MQTETTVNGSPLPVVAELSIAPTKTQLFGLDLGSFQRDLMTAWHGMLNWRVVAWIRPQQAIRIHLPDGSVIVSNNLRSVNPAVQKSANAARFEAVLLPEHLVLRTTLKLPKLSPFEMDAALNLEVLSLSPFSKSDVTWSREITPTDNADVSIQVELTMTSRKLVSQYIDATYPTLKKETSEVLVRSLSSSHFLRLPGFGEARRVRHGRIWTWVNVSLVAIALALSGAMAVTPSVQLFFRFMQGYRAMFELQGQAAPVLKQRESFVRVSDQLANLSEIVGKSVPALQALTLITQALPDDTSLLNLQIKDSKVSISGQTVNSAALMKLLDSTPGLRDVRAPSPATKPPGAARESFTIELTIDPTPIKTTP